MKLRDGSSVVRENKVRLAEGHVSDYVLMAMTFDKFAQVSHLSGENRKNKERRKEKEKYKESKMNTLGGVCGSLPKGVDS